MKIIISGGGTGGHIFPAIAIANEIKRLQPTADILFVGAEGRMEMEKVPAAGYRIKGLPVMGFDRRHLWRNISVILKLIKSFREARKILRDFKPDVVVGVGGYASGPILKAAQKKGIPTLIQEQNSYAGVTNKLLAKKADSICVAYKNMHHFFPADKIILTGNPVRREITDYHKSKAEACNAFGLDSEAPTVLVVGGSLGAATINNAILSRLADFETSGVQLIWQTGKNFGDKGKKAAKGKQGIVVADFITNMGDAYAAADLVISRAGACAISEIELLGKATILVPSPNVAEDHQTKNARALQQENAAILIPDAEAGNSLVDTLFLTLNNKESLSTMSQQVSALALRNSDTLIAKNIIALASANNKK